MHLRAIRLTTSTSAGLQLQLFVVEKQGHLEPAIMRSMYSFVEKLQNVCYQCRVFNGFTENYLDGIQPTWCSLPYLALYAYKMITTADTQRTLPEIDTTITEEALRIMAPRWKLAGMQSSSRLTNSNVANIILREMPYATRFTLKGDTRLFYQPKPMPP
jgi:hypothetical protein